MTMTLAKPSELRFDPPRPRGPIKIKYEVFAQYRGNESHHRSGGYEIFFRGGFGTAKTTALVEREGRYRLEYPGSPGLLARSSLTVFNRTTLKAFLEMWGKYGTYKKGDSRFEWINGSITHFFGMDAINTEEALKSFEVVNVGIDEADEIDEDMYAIAKGRTRWQPMEGTALRALYLEKNWGVEYIDDEGILRWSMPYSTAGISNFNGRDWIYYRFKNERHKNETIKARGYIEATTDENHSLPGGYIQGLIAERGQGFVDRYVYGNENTLHGRILHKFRWTRDTDGNTLAGGNVYDPAEIPNHWPLYLGVDVGYRHPTAGLKAFISDDGRIWIDDEYLESERTSSENAKAIKAWVGPRALERVYGSPDAAKTDQTSGRSALMDYVDVGLTIIPSGPNYDDSINLVNQLFAAEVLEPGQVSKPKLMISSRCKRLIQQIESYTWQMRRRKAGGGAQEQDPSGGDWDLYDDLRMLVCGIPQGTRAEPDNLTPDRAFLTPSDARKRLGGY